MPTEPTLDRERELFAAGARLVIGVDEVGRGAIAGPVVVGVAVIGDPAPFPEGLRDSKLLSEKKRESLIEPIDRWARALAVGEASAAEIDEHGVVSALSRAAERAFASLAIGGLDVTGGSVILDGSHNWLSRSLVPPLSIEVRAKADRDCAVVAAASVWAKVSRDRFMSTSASEGDPYLWSSNKGYGSAAHFDAIRRWGVTSLHRSTWLTSVWQSESAE